MSDFIAGKEKDELTLVIGNREVTITSGKLLKTMDTGADAFTCVMPFEPELDEEIDELTKAYSYSEAKVYIGGYLQMTGLLYNVKATMNNDGIVKELEIYTKTADMIDSVWQPPYEENSIKLDEICINQASQFGIDVVLDSGVDVGGIFSRISVEQTEKCFEQLSKLAAQRGLLLSCTEYGELLIVKPNINGNPVGTLQIDNPYTDTYEVKFNGRERFYQYEAILSSASSSRTLAKQKAIDSAIPATRFTAFKAEESLPGEGLNAAEWKRNKMAADSFKNNLPVNTWYAPNTELWKPNTMLTVKNPVISKNGFTFLIPKVEFNYEISGTMAVLYITPPTMYQIGDIEESWN